MKIHLSSSDPLNVKKVSLLVSSCRIMKQRLTLNSLLIDRAKKNSSTTTVKENN